MGRSHSHALRVRYHECDAQGHVFNAHYLTYFDMSITELWREALGSYAAMLALGVDVVVAEAVLRFRRPGRFDDVLEAQIEVARLGTTSMATHHRVLRGSELLVEGDMVHVFVETAAYTKLAIPDRIRVALG